MEVSSFLSVLDQDNLVLLIKEYNELYDPKHPNFSCSEIRELCWKLVANRLGENVAICKRSWMRLRYLAKMYVLAKNEGNEDYPELDFKEQMSFLLPYLGAKVFTNSHNFPPLDESNALDKSNEPTHGSGCSLENEMRHSKNPYSEIEALLFKMPSNKLNKLIQAFQDVMLSDFNDSQADQDDEQVTSSQRVEEKL